jgi:dinuclear metal center YbgI/SA1388 family protein
MANLSEIMQFLEQEFEIASTPDYSWNGLQVEGKQEVRKIVGAVDAAEETIKKAIDKKANILITHHGLYWRDVDPSLSSFNKIRIRPLITNDVSLIALHLPLDRHNNLGNNAQILKLLGSSPEKEFLSHEGKNVGWIGSVNSGREEIIGMIKSKINPDAEFLSFGKEKINKIAVCSGAANHRDLYDAYEKSDIFITGEQFECYQLVKDMKFNVVFAGHNATEVFGIKALLKVLEEKFKVETEFIDCPTGI